MEKVNLRLPLTLWFTATLWLILFLFGVLFYKPMGQELPAALFLVAFSLLILRFARTNENAGLLIAWSLLIAWQVLDGPSGMFVFLAQLVILILFLIAASLLLRKAPLFSKKPVPRAMDKYNWGKAPQLHALEEDLNRKLNTKKGGRITLQ